MMPMPTLNCALNTAIMVELKNGDSYNGILESADYYMNLKMNDVLLTSADGTQFFKMPYCYIRGNAVKNFRLSEGILTKAAEEKQARKKGQAKIRGRARGGFRPRGR